MRVSKLQAVATMHMLPRGRISQCSHMPTCVSTWGMIQGVRRHQLTSLDRGTLLLGAAHTGRYLQKSTSEAPRQLAPE